MNRIERTARRVYEIRKGVVWDTRLGDRGGLALIATLMLIALVAALTTAALSGAMSAISTAGSDYQDARVYYAAEAGGEATLAQLKIALTDGYLADDELAKMKPPALQDISFDSFAVRKVGTAFVETVTDGPYAGLYGLTQNVDIYSRAMNSRGDQSAIILRTKAQAIPIFQFGVFFEEDLEATNGPPMEFLGRVHSNGNIYLSSDNAWYRDVITTPNKIFHDRKDFHSVKNGVFVNDDSGHEVRLTFDSRTHPDREAFKARSCADFDCRVMTDAFDVDSLRLPLPEGVPAYELIRPREDTDGDAEREVKFAWNADLYLKVDLSDIRTRDEVCAPITPPDKSSGDITILPQGPVYPGATVQLVVSHPLLDCAEFDGRAQLHVQSKGVDYTVGMTDCTFTVVVPSDADKLKIEIRLDEHYYWELDHDLHGKVEWDLRDGEPFPTLTVERTGGSEVPSSQEICSIFRFEWSNFYDGRENRLKEVLNIDVDRLGIWVAGSAGRTAEVIYVEFVLPPDISGYSRIHRKGLIVDGALDPAVRLVNGERLPNRMTVASEWPMYIMGDYNRIDKKPAAIAGDGISILSNAWEDEDNRPTDHVYNKCKYELDAGESCREFDKWDWSRSNALETTVNAAFLAGHWPTPCDHADSSCLADGSSAYYSDWYGGGLENFPRFLERWRSYYGGAVTYHYRGALVSPFTSAKTTGTWNGTYYVPPQRDWSFDTDFRDPALLPPGTPNVGFVIRTAMREAY